MNDSSASAQKLPKGRKLLKARTAQVTNGDSINVSQVTNESNVTISETSSCLKEKDAKKRKPQKRTKSKADSEVDSFEASKEQSSTSLENACQKNVASSKKRKVEPGKDGGKDVGKGGSLKDKQKLDRQKGKTEDAMSDEDKVSASEELKYWKRLRQDLERVRLLLELIRKREKMKSSLVCIMLFIFCAVLLFFKRSFTIN